MVLQNIERISGVKLYIVVSNASGTTYCAGGVFFIFGYRGTTVLNVENCHFVKERKRFYTKKIKNLPLQFWPVCRILVEKVVESGEK